MANWGATPEEEKFEATELEALAHNFQTVTRILTAVNEEKKFPSLSRSRERARSCQFSPSMVGPVRCDARRTCCKIIQVIGNEISDRQGLQVNLRIAVEMVDPWLDDRDPARHQFVC
jgi:hypothetical protein